MNARTTPLLAIFLLCAATAFADPLIHIVAKGETLYAIARHYEVSLDAIMKANDLKDASRITVGMRLAIPSSTPAASPQATYVVKKGDTLYGIAKAHGVSVDSIVSANKLSSTSIKEGQALSIPPAPSSAAGVASAPAAQSASAPTTKPASKDEKPVSTPKPAEPPATATAAAYDKSLKWPVAGSISLLQGKLKGVSIAASDPAIVAIRAGTVISAGPFRGFGKVAFVQARDGLVYVYGGAENLAVKVGDAVRSGAEIGSLGPSRLAYFFVFKGADTIDPAGAPRE